MLNSLETNTIEWVVTCNTQFSGMKYASPGGVSDLTHFQGKRRALNRPAASTLLQACAALN